MFPKGNQTGVDHFILFRAPYTYIYIYMTVVFEIPFSGNSHLREKKTFADPIAELSRGCFQNIHHKSNTRTTLSQPQLESRSFSIRSSTQSKLPQPQLESRNLSVPKWHAKRVSAACGEVRRLSRNFCRSYAKHSRKSGWKLHST